MESCSFITPNARPTLEAFWGSRSLLEGNGKQRGSGISKSCWVSGCVLVCRIPRGSSAAPAKKE